MAWRPEGPNSSIAPGYVKGINHEEFDVRRAGGDGFGQ
jgi:hypothetical protein